MKRLFVAVGALALVASSAYAADNQMYMAPQNGKNMVMGGSNSEGTELLMGENGAKPGNCPDGSYYTADNHIATACDSDTQYEMMAPEAGSMMSNGQPYPEGTMMMKPKS